MQITIDTAACSGPQLAAVARFFESLAGLAVAPAGHVVPSKPIAPEDRPDTGRTPPPAIVQAATQATAAASALPVQVLQIPATDAAFLESKRFEVVSPDPAAVFAMVPPVPSSPAVPSAAPSVPVVPPLPQGVGAAHVPPPAPSLPTATAAPTVPAAAPGLELDVRGLPWDQRIHASTKVKNGDGSWRQRRGLNDEALLKRIETELLAAVAARAVTPTAAALQAAPPVPGGVPAANDSPTTFGAFMERTSALIMNKQITPDAVNAALLQHLQMPTMIGLSTRPDLIPTAWGIVQSLLVV